MVNLWGQSKQSPKLIKPVIRCRIDYTFQARFTFLTLGFNFKRLRKHKRRKVPQQPPFIPGVLCEYTGNALFWNSCACLNCGKKK